MAKLQRMRQPQTGRAGIVDSAHQQLHQELDTELEEKKNAIQTGESHAHVVFNHASTLMCFVQIAHGGQIGKCAG